MRTPSILITATALGLATFAPAAHAAAPPAMTVSVHAASGATSSYFTLSAHAGRKVQAGTLELRNRRNRRITVRLDPVGALTASTLGSAYEGPAAAAAGQARWIRLAQRRIVLSPRGKAIVPVSIETPGDAAPGDYLSGISVEALGQKREARVRGNIAISSVQRYAVGLLVKVPGSRHGLIRLPSAAVKREPAGLTFYVNGRNEGNRILQNVRGSFLVTRGRRTVARAAIGPGTFVTGTSIAYPLLAAREVPREGAVYRVRAVMRYVDGVARLDTKVRFGHLAAKTQQDFGGPHVDEPRGGDLPLWAILALGGLVAAGLIGFLVFLLRRRRTPGPQAARRAQERALAAARAAGEPLSLLRLEDACGKISPRKLAALVRPHMRRNDGLYRLGASELLIIAPDTQAEAAKALSSELHRHLSRDEGLGGIKITVSEFCLDRWGEPQEPVEQPPVELDEIELSVDMLYRDRSTTRHEG